MNSAEIARSTYVDPSALLKLYLDEPESEAMVAWRKKIKAPLNVTMHGRVELVTGITLAAFRKDIDDRDMVTTLAELDDDFQQGQFVIADVLWRSALDRAGSLSRRFTPALGARSFDLVHVACALELEAKSFLTFDHRQRELARAVGFRLVFVPGANSEVQ